MTSNKWNSILRLSLLLLIGLFPLLSFAQSDSIPKKKFSDVVNFRGYLKDLRSANFIKLDDITTDNLIHNRLNFKFYVSKNITAALEVRNRIFYGEMVKLNPNYADLVDVGNGLVDLSHVWVNKNSFVFQSIIDRGWVNYSHERFDLRIGRQRINWGINTVWNPNDLFNAYNFVDFDYEERPGSDALRFQYYTKSFNTLEVAVAPNESIDKTVAALMYKFNKWNYDFQVLGGNYNTDLALGIGWAGNIKNAGFKGEATYFQSRENFADTNGVINASITADYAFKNSLYVNASLLFNSQGITESNPLALLSLYSGTISPKNMMPSKYNAFAQVSYTFSPLINGSLSAIYGAGLNLLFVNPTVGISIANNWELALVGQLVYADNFNQEFKNLGNAVFIRTKWSFGN